MNFVVAGLTVLLVGDAFTRFRSKLEVNNKEGFSMQTRNPNMDLDYRNTYSPVQAGESAKYTYGAVESINSGIRDPTKVAFHPRLTSTENDDNTSYRSGSIRAMPAGQKWAKIGGMKNNNDSGGALRTRVHKGFDYIFDRTLEPSVRGNPTHGNNAYNQRRFRMLAGRDTFRLKSEEKDDTPLYDPMARNAPWLHDRSIDHFNKLDIEFDYARKHVSPKNLRMELPSKRDYPMDTGSYWKSDKIVDENGLPYRNYGKTIDELRFGETKVGGAIGRAPSLQGPSLAGDNYYGDTRQERVRRMIIDRPASSTFDPHRSYQHSVPAHLVWRDPKNVVGSSRTVVEPDLNTTEQLRNQHHDDPHVRRILGHHRMNDPEYTGLSNVAGSAHEQRAKLGVDHRLGTRRRAMNKTEGFDRTVYNTDIGKDLGGLEIDADAHVNRGTRRANYSQNKRPGHYIVSDAIANTTRPVENHVPKELRKVTYTDSRRQNIPYVKAVRGRNPNFDSTVQHRDPKRAEYDFMTRDNMPEFEHKLGSKRAKNVFKNLYRKIVSGRTNKEAPGFSSRLVENLNNEVYHQNEVIEKAIIRGQKRANQMHGPDYANEFDAKNFTRKVRRSTGHQYNRTEANTDLAKGLTIQKRQLGRKIEKKTKRSIIPASGYESKHYEVR